ncbi:GAP family protein [Agromyces soli]
MTGDAWQLIPLAIALALSSVPITVTITVLLTAKNVSVPFAAGWVLGLAAVLTVFTLGGLLLPSRPSEAHEVTTSLKIVIGALLLLLGLGALGWALRARHGERVPREPRFTKAKLNGPSAFGLAALLDVRPKSIIICAAAGIALQTVSKDPGPTVALGLAFVAISVAPVVGLVAYTLARPDRAERVLNALKAWLVRNGGLLSAAVLLAIGGYMLVNALLER